MLNDAQARLESVDVNHSIILQAPAGSGKTSLLVDRFINLLKVCQDPAECLAITFSKKAAFEMRYRVLQKLEQLTYSDNTAIYLQVLKNPNKLKILTIDALCASLAKQAPILSRCGLNLKINESPEKLYQEAVDQLLTSFDNPNLITKIFEYFCNDYELIKDLFVELLYKREQWLPLIIPIKLAHTSNNPEVFDIKNFLEQNLQQAINDTLEDLLNYLPNQDQQKKILHLAKYAAGNIDDHNNNIVSCKDLQGLWPEANYKYLSIWRGLADLLLTKDCKPRVKVTATQGFLPANKFKNPTDKKIAQQFKDEMQNLLTSLRDKNTVFFSKLQQVVILPNSTGHSESWDLLQNLFFLLPELVAHLMLVFQERQEVDFTQVAIAALEAIGTDNYASDLALFLDYKIKHMLVDEFQDTSLLQFNLIEKLIIDWQHGDGRTIFLVGDPMQSIYRFRQANVNLFIKAQRFGIGNLKLKNLYLNTNFRSTNNIINYLNELFVNVFPAKNDLNYSSVAYNPSVACNSNCDASLEDNSRVQFLSAKDSIEEAAIISDLVQKIKQQNPKYSIAILVRTRSHAVEIIKYLRKDNISYQANEIELMDHHTIVNDLSSLTKVILYPQHVIAWLALLRSPLVGLQLSDLHAFYLNTEINFFESCLLNQLHNYKDNNNLSDEARCRLDFVLPIIFDAIRQKEVLHLSQLVKKTWKLLGGDLFSTRFDLQVAEDYFHKLLKIRDIFVINCIDDLISQSFIQVSRSQINPQDLQIMTIHKSKGLEFDVVILPSMNKSPRNHKESLFLWEERTNFSGTYLLFAPVKSAMQSENAIYNFLKHSEHERDSHEAKRLLYVAMTRAKMNFYGFGSSLDYISSRSFLKYLQPYVDINSNQTMNETQYNNINIEQKCSKLVLKAIRIPVSWYKK